MKTVTKEAIAARLREIQGWFDSVQIEEGIRGRAIVSIATRANGDVGDEEPGEADVIEAQKIVRQLRADFGEIDAEVQIIGEWVDVVVHVPA